MHSDTPGAAALARAVRQALEESASWSAPSRPDVPDHGPNDTGHPSVMLGVGPIGRHVPSSEAGTRVDWQVVLETLVRDRGPALLRYGHPGRAGSA